MRTRHFSKILGLIWGLLAGTTMLGADNGKSASAQLFWRNGDVLKGNLLTATDREFTWESPLFAEPLSLLWSAISRLWCPGKSEVSADPFLLNLRDGTSLHGQLLAIDPETVTVSASMHGPLRIQRSCVLNIRRLQARSVFVGPLGEVGWKEIDPENYRSRGGNQGSESGLVTGANGCLSLPYFATKASLPLHFPAKFSVEFVVSSSRLPDFSLTLIPGKEERATIETWRDQVVLSAGAEFKVLCSLPAQERRVALRLCWNRETKHCAVFRLDGEKLAEWVVPANSEGGDEGVSLASKGRDLRLEFLRILPWNEQPPAQVDLTQSRVELQDGRVLNAPAISLKSGVVQLVSSSANAPAEPVQSVPLEEIEGLVFSSDAPEPDDGKTALTLRDGTYLLGQIQNAHDDWIGQKTSFSEGPVPTELRCLRSLRLSFPAKDIQGPEMPRAFSDQLVLPDAVLHGSFLPSENERFDWLATGAVRPISPLPEVPVEVTRMPWDKTVSSRPFAYFMLANGDIIPSSMRGANHEGAELESPFVETTKLDRSILRAVQLPAASRLDGFLDPGWSQLKPSGKPMNRTRDAVQFAVSNGIFHRSAACNGEVRFTLPSNKYCSILIRLFAEKNEGTQGLCLLLRQYAGQGLYLRGEGDLAQSNNSISMKIEKEIDVRLAIDRTSVTFILNDVPRETFRVSQNQRKSTMLSFEPRSEAGNLSTSLELTNFSCSPAAGEIFPVQVDALAKAQALTVPRFRRDDPPRHALIARNGDVLRGEIEAMTANAFAFRSGLENLRVPQDRVNAVVWLQPPERTPRVEKSKVEKALGEQIISKVKMQRVTVSAMLAFLKDQVPDLEFQPIRESETRKFTLTLGNSTVARALEQIGKASGCRFQLDAKGEKILSLPASTPVASVSKTYWLHRDSFPTSSTAQKILETKGLEFPAGTSASWNPATCELKVTHDLGAQARLVALLDSDFGGNLGSPTHWIGLRNGGRFGLAVDKFGEKVLLGHHPVYGRCELPMQEVLTLRTTPFPANAATAQLLNWPLVDAPEPVLPVAANGGSALAGKDAKPFKLPLLQGDAFELAKQKGKVVVLDFWATWCGPCIQSLPETLKTVAEFSADPVTLIGVNQGETATVVRAFLEARKWPLTVALDADGKIFEQYGGSGIPLTVVIAPDGKIVWAQEGTSDEGPGELKAAINKALQQTPKTLEPPAAVPEAAVAPSEPEKIQASIRAN